MKTTTIRLSRDTKRKLDSLRVSGQTYEGLILELIELRERLNQKLQDHEKRIKRLENVIRMGNSQGEGR